MSVRVCYVERADRGTMLRALRLVGQTGEDQWPGEGGGEAGEADDGAAWIKQRLAGTRSTSSLAMLCLDIEGGICSWLTSPSTNPSVVATLARQGAGYSESASRPGSSAIEFYAGDGFSSSIQALETQAMASGSPSRFRRSPSVQPQESLRLAVLAMGDVPARLLVDALDRQGVPVDSVASLWHLMAGAWDPAAPRLSEPAVDQVLVGQTTSLTAVIIIDPQTSRLIWCWSKAGRLVVAGSMRVRQGAPETDALANADETAPTTTLYGEEEVSRLVAEWLTWAAQVNQAPSRFVCVLPDSTQAADFGRALGKAWPGGAVDVVTNDDPVGATLKRTANILDNTPLKGEEPDPRAGLVDLSRRPGTQHRRMYIWWSGAIAAAAVVMGVVGFQLRGSADSARLAAVEWRKQGLAAIGEVFPDALVDRPGVNKYAAFKSEVEKAEKKLRPTDRTDETMPVVEELETISLVVGNSGFSIESIDLDSKGLPRLYVVTDRLEDAERLGEALKRVSGSHIAEWTPNYSTKKEGDVSKVRANWSGTWIKNKPGGPR